MNNKVKTGKMWIPAELNFLLSKQKDKRVITRILKVYEALLYKKGERNDWFDVPAVYLEKINARYYLAIDALIEHGIIEYRVVNVDVKYNSLFDSQVIKRKFYFPNQCMKYKFLIKTVRDETNMNDGYEIPFNIDSTKLYDSEKWFQLTRYSLLHIGVPVTELNISRDNFSRRLHTNITGKLSGSLEHYRSYKNLLCGGDYYVIDSKTSQPRLLWLTLKEIGIPDPNLDYIFENDLDFYEYLIERIPALKEGYDDPAEWRVSAKELFTAWINGTGYLNPDLTPIREIFTVANYFVRTYKTVNYRDACKLLQYKEAKIFIDDLLNNIPVDFCLTVHDSLIVKKEDAQKVLEFCQQRHPEIIFNMDVIKPKKTSRNEND